MVDKPTILGGESSLELQRERDLRVEAVRIAAETVAAAELRAQEAETRARVHRDLADGISDKFGAMKAERDYAIAQRSKAERSAETAWSVAIGLAVCLAGLAMALAIAAGFRAHP